MVSMSWLPTGQDLLQYPRVREHYVLVRYQLGQQPCEHQLPVKGMTWLHLRRLSLL